MIEIAGYVIKREVCAGANATILLAEQTSLAREVALKVLSPERAADRAQTERFLQVARTLASFSHPNIVGVYDVGTMPGQAPYFSMQYLPGGDFLGRVQQGISEPDLTETLASVARALGYIHERGLVHRAVNPQNVLYDAYNTPVLINFGLAPAPNEDPYATSAGFAVDAGRYMSPEQARGAELTPASDLYALGALCFLGLTGRPPYDGADGFAVAYAHVFEPIPRLPADKARWQPLVDRALAKEAKDRFTSADEFLDALAAIGLEAPAAFEPEPAAVAEAAAPAPAAAPERELPATTAAPLPPRPRERVPALKPDAAPRPGWMRAWPLAVAVLGVVLIAAALLIPRRSAPPVAPAAQTAAPGPGTPPAPSEPAAAESPPPSSDAAAATPDQPAAAGDGEPAQDATAATGPGDVESEFESDDPAKAPTVVDPLYEAIKLGRIDLAGLRLTSPPATNALERFQFALKLEPKSKSARQGIVDVAKKYIELADKNPPSAASGATGLAAYGQQLDHAEEVAKLLPEGADVLKEVAARRRKAAEPLVAQGRAAADIWDKGAAKAAYEAALQIDPENAAAREGLKYVPTIGEPGFVFRDKMSEGAAAPPMVVMPGAKLAFARHAVTRGEFRRFWASAGRSKFGNAEISCRDRESIFRSSKKRSWENPDITQDDNHPVVCVSWEEALAYAQWLSARSGKRYRLPSAAEFNQVAARAPRGDCATANLADAAYNRQFESRDGSSCNDGFAATAPVEHYPAVEGIYDIDGNVREWVATCANGNAATAAGACRDVRVSGRGWLSVASKENVNASDTYDTDLGLNTVGFRVVREMSN